MAIKSDQLQTATIWKERRSDPNYQVPRPHRFDIERPRLVEHLHVVPNKLIALIAPSGYGKTTLAAQLARSWPHSVAWLSLSPDEAEPAMLLHSLAGAVARPEIALPAWERAVQYGVSPERLATALANDLNSCSHRFMLVLDALYFLSPDSGRYLAAFLRRLDSRHRVVVTGYEEPEGVLGQLLATAARLLGPKQLAFTLAESRAFLGKISDHTEHEIEAEAVHIALSGWPAALGMVAHGAPAAHASAERLVRSIVEQLPAELQTALPEVAVLEVWSEQRASAVGCRLPPRWLRLVRRSGLPLLPLGHDTYRPHQLVIDLLDNLLRQNPPRHRQLHLAAAHVSKSAGHPLLALKHLLIAGDSAEAATLAAEIVPAWEHRSQWKLVRQALERLPLEALPPALQVSLGIALLETGEPNRGEALLAAHRDGPAAPWSCFGLALAAYRRGALQQTLELANDGLRQNPDQRALVQLLRTRAVVHSHLGHLEEAALDARECVAQAEKVGDQPLLVQALTVQHFILGRLGQEEQVIAIAERAIELARRVGTLHKALPAIDGLFSHYLRLNRAQEVSYLVLELLEEAKAGYPLAIPWMLRNLGYNWLQTGVIAAALPQFNEAVALFERNGDTANARETLSESIYCLLRLGRVEEAAALLPKLHDLFSEAECQNSAATRLYSEGLVRFYQGQLNEAQELLAQSRNRPQRAHPDRDNVLAVAYLAEIARRQFRLERSHLEELMQLLDRYGSDWLLSLEAKPLAALYRFAIAQGWFAERLRPHLLTLAQPLAGQPAQPRPVLELRTLGEFRATLNGERLELAPKERELLSFLALHGRVQRDVIVDALWPELDLVIGRDALNTHNYRLRAALRVALGPGYGQPMKFDPATTTYSLSSELELRLDTTALEAAGAAKWRRYGAFLEGCEAEWVAIRRAYYQDLLNRPSA